jgi:hypothetical protein
MRASRLRAWRWKMSTMTPVRSSTSAPVAFSRLRSWLGDSSWSTTTTVGFSPNTTCASAPAAPSSGESSASAASASQRSFAFEVRSAAPEAMTPGPPVRLASSSSFPVPSTVPAPACARRWLSVATVS